MYVCVCHAVTERQVRQAASNGARRLRDLSDTLGVATQCGRCASHALTCLRSCDACPNAQSGTNERRAPHERRQESHPTAQQAA
ncbi:(2Fe-2S)-binding protein [Niveibacterium sp. 24ML]|uniref:(2Fe-2S)-binding protein n=1 Tax=Niveibacterium sp. 24ML TaxID=2985512 RepID=UPI00226F1949|nr:(2Fe-2S)-binding protein [Niveibacterium sp. 24ML]MCX9158206.1 (2Fe-2S)-binding protein [Niveibacterium sp. 24ML]